MSMRAIGITLCVFMIALAIVGCIVQHEERKARRLGRYRPSHDNRFPHRDEFRAFMRDCK